MSNRSYPFTGWVLGGTFIPKQVELVAHRRWYAADWHESSSGKDYRFEDVFETKDQALDGGEKRLLAAEARIAKQIAGIAKKRANLEKAARMKP